MKSSKTNICGKYLHYKSKEYKAYGYAYDNDGNTFVLYQQLYDSNDFWIREKNSFLDRIEKEDDDSNKKTPRFRKTEDYNSTEMLTDLARQLKANPIYIRHVDTGDEYRISSICYDSANEKSNSIQIFNAKLLNTSSYYSDIELANRMGYYIFTVNGKIKASESKLDIAEKHKLVIGDNSEEIIEKQFNPCSIDLHISKNNFLVTKSTDVDPSSIEHIASPDRLWKRVKTFKKNGKDCIKIKPGKSILTHIDEKIKIPFDCAGKIEIKSTFARLSLGITTADFCNPGYIGYFPLVITNYGKHTVIIHPHEMMAQLMLININCPILNDYSTRATHKDKDGIDDGTPYSFWRERAIKSFRGQHGVENIINFYNNIIKSFSSTNSNDINAERDRFENTFLTYARKKLKNDKYCKNGKTDPYKIMKDYISKEKLIKGFFSLRILSPVLTLIIPSLITIFMSDKFTGNLLKAFIVSGIVFVVLCGISVSMFIKNPKAFCTFEKFDYKTISIEKIDE